MYIAIVMGAVGVALLVSGIPSRSPLHRRVDPYVSELGAGSARRLIVDRLQGFFGPDREAALARRLEAAGRPWTTTRFRADQLVWGICGGAVAVFPALFSYLRSGGIDLRSVPLLLAIAALAGWAARDWWLGREIRVRSASIRGDLPLVLDLLTISLVAGEGIVPACERAAKHLPGGALSGEIDRVAADIRAGLATLESFEAMARRVSDPAVGRMVDAICTAMERGTPLADTLRAQADDVRESDRRRLLELGGKREVAMLLPVVFLIMPVVVIFGLLPGLVSLDLLVP